VSIYWRLREVYWVCAREEELSVARTTTVLQGYWLLTAFPC
jgi:hypothetical protein